MTNPLSLSHDYGFVEHLSFCVCVSLYFPSVQDSKISTSMPILDLIDAIQPGSIKYDLLKTEDLNEEEKLNNAKYVHAMGH